MRRSFWLLPAAGLVTGLVLGTALPAVDDKAEIEIPLPFLALRDPDGVRSLVEVIATVTVSVAGIAFSVTVVAFQLAAQQLSPRVLRTFQTDRLSQTTLAAFVGTFVYSLLVLAAFGSPSDSGVPRLSAAVAVLAAIGAFALFVAFVHNTIISLQASTLIRRIAADGQHTIATNYPAGIGSDASESASEAQRARGQSRGELRARGAGFLVRVKGDSIVESAERLDGLVIQRAAIGDFVVTGGLLAEVYGDEAESLAERCRPCFAQADERNVVQDIAFPIRQLADIALRGLSPSLNDPTTAENAMDSLANTLIELARTERAPMARGDRGGTPRFVARAPDLDDLVRLGFAQVRVAASPHPVVCVRLIELLGEIERAATRAGIRCAETAVQARLLAEGAARAGLPDADLESVRAAARRGPDGSG